MGSQKKTLLIDGDVWLYKSLFASEETTEFAGEFQLSCNFEKACELFDGFVEDLIEKTSADVIVALSVGENFRHKLYPSYKAQRKSHRRPINLPELRGHVQAKWPTACRPGIEADDALGILATGDRLPGKKLIVSIDKDMLQIPGLHLNPDKPKQGVIRVTTEEGDRLHMMQTLTGDTVDNYPGCPGIGAKRAEKFLTEPAWRKPTYSDWDVVVRVYEMKGLTEADALIQARLARILRVEDWDADKKEPKLWTPPST